MIILPLLIATSLVSTPSVTTTIIPTVAPTVTSEIQKIREVIQEKVKAKLQEISQTADNNPKRGYLGTITKIDSNQINLDTKSQNRTITINADTVFLNTKSTKVKSTELKVGREILVIGLLDDQNNFLAKRIIITTSKSVQNLKTTIYGQIVDISTTNSVMALIPVSNKNTQYQVKIDTKNIQVLSKTGEKLTIKDVTKGKKVTIISTPAGITNQTLSAEKIIVM